MAFRIEILFLLTSVFILGHAENTTVLSSSSLTVDNSTAPSTTAATSFVQTSATSTTDAPSAITSSSTTASAVEPSTTATSNGQTSKTIAASTTDTPSTSGVISPTTTAGLTDTSSATVNPSATSVTPASSTTAGFPSLTDTSSLQTSYTPTTGASLSATTPLSSSTSSATQAPVTTAAVSASSIQPSSTSVMPSTSAVVDTTTTAATTQSPATTTQKGTTYLPFNKESAVYILSLNLSTVPNTDAYIFYNLTNQTFADMESKIQTALNGLTFSLIKKTDALYSIEFKFFLTQNGTDLELLVNDAITNLTTLDFDVSNSTKTATSAFFRNTFTDECKAINICPLSFQCDKGQGCKHACAGETCNGNGQCIVDVKSDTSSAVKCICDESYDTEYYGDKCESSRTGKLQIIAIISGVLGATILVLFIALLVVCLSGHRKESGYNFSSKKYDNSAYDPVEK